MRAAAGLGQARLLVGKRRLLPISTTRLPMSTDASSSDKIFMEPLYILGAGSIGLLFGAHLRMAFPSYPLRMLIRKHHQPYLQLEQEHNNLYSMQVSISQHTRDMTRPQNPRFVSLSAQIISQQPQHHNQKIRNLLITTKAHHAKTALQSILPRLHHETTVIVLCNGGLAVRDELKEIIPNIYLGTTTHGARVERHDELYHVTQAGIGQTHLESLIPLCNLLDRAGLNCKSLSSQQIQTKLWQKLAANCVCNPLTAFLDCPNGALLEHCQYRQLAPQVVEEVSRVAMQSLQQSTENTDPVSFQLLQPNRLMEYVETVIRDNWNNRSSMWQDVVLHQRQTEIDYLNGYVVATGRTFGIECPANQELCQRIQQVQQQYYDKKV